MALPALGAKLWDTNGIRCFTTMLQCSADPPCSPQSSVQVISCSTLAHALLANVALLATEGSKTARKNQFCQTNVRGKLWKDDPNLADNTFCKMTDDILEYSVGSYLTCDLIISF